MKVAKQTPAKPIGNTKAISGTSTKLTVDPTTPKPGVNARVTVDVSKAGKAPVGFQDLHTKPMHFIAVSEDFTDFIHVHPERGSGSVFSVDVAFDKASRYRTWTEVQPTGDDKPTIAVADIATQGAAPTSVQLAVDGDSQKTVRGLRVILTGAAALKAGSDAKLTLDVVDSASGKPAKLQTLLGAPAHAIAISSDREQFMHLHAARAGGATVPAGGGGAHGAHNMGTTTAPAGAPTKLAVDVKFPAPGLYKIFVQMQKDGDVVTVPFVVNVS
jgi:hypothetical protein